MAVPTLPIGGEFEAISSLSAGSVTRKQLNGVIGRISRCKKRLQLRFPVVFRDGIILQYLLPFIKANDRIRTFACALSHNNCSGFYALSKLLEIRSIVKFNVRINHFVSVPPPLFSALSASTAERMQLRFDVISDENMRDLCEALRQNPTLKGLQLTMAALSDTAAECLGELCAKSTVRRMSLAINSQLTTNQIDLILGGLCRSQHIEHLDVENCKLGAVGMARLTATLSQNECANITALTIGNNGADSLRAFFAEMGHLQFIEKLICNESLLDRAEQVDLAVISASLNRLHAFRKLSVLQLPLFIFADTPQSALRCFVDALGHREHVISTLHLFPLFEHLDRASYSRNPAYCRRISHFFRLLFDGLSEAPCLRKLYIEMIGSERNFFTKDVADAFLTFLMRSRVNELYLPFVCLADLNGEVLESIGNCKHLISITDDTLDYHWLERETKYKYVIDQAQKAELVKSQSYHRIAHRQCKQNIAAEIEEQIPIKEVAMLVSEFCGFEADPERWLL